MRIKNSVAVLVGALACATVLAPPASASGTAVSGTVVVKGAAASGARGTAAKAAAPGGATRYTLSLSGAQSTWYRAVRLSCPADPSGHLHPKGDQACADLATVQGNIANMRRDTQRCAPGGGSITATMSGTYDGRSVQWNKTYRDQCEMFTATRAVFRF
ncbi:MULTISPECIES: SSI family serine proteinase inhibitor [Actinosynnema]|uniref:SSI family serine proteinase inhibitor n=1 Tax=Actinosynnema TaxID=40566 RepID=UPI0020A5D69C|nr:SSI family serine proteinase inhibitor [Actinosynnema pretiosum]MCP2096360.1 Subtilisin inhibitor-like [Actinosynnema pretiosum]